MKIPAGRSPWRDVSLLLAVAAGAASLSLAAQPSPQGEPGRAGDPAASQAPSGRGADAAGRGGRAGGFGRGATAEPDFSPRPPVQPLTPAEQAARFWLPPGYTMTPVLTEPDVQEPAQIAFDGNGRMFVVELRGYMQDAVATGELAPVGRISVHEDRDNDGVYETHNVFVDNLVFPRFVTPVGANAILTKESNADEVWKYTDTNGDSVADTKEFFATGLGRLLNVEHQESGFIWALDNWIYSTINPVRIRWTPSGVLREPTGSNQSQWGATQDNYGKVWFQNGGTGMPGYFQFPVVYGMFANPDQFERDLNITWGAPVLLADMQGGMGAVRMPDGSLSRATGGAGNDIFRGDRLPQDLVGDYFYGEVVARVVRRLRPVKSEGLTQLRNAYPLREFIRSTDPLFRPTDMTTAPDGTMYITDMYRGIIQESQWAGPGSYLQRRVAQYGLDKIVRHGRIWRLSYDGMPRRTAQPRMLSETPAQLVAHLTDPNGWWRDTAQQLLVLKQDTSVVPALRTMATSSPNQLARIHALWTLEGLSAADAGLVRSLMKDPDEQIRIQAVRVSETLYKAGDRSFGADYKTLTKDAHDEVVLQAIMTLNTLAVPDAAAAIDAARERSTSKGVRLVADAIRRPAAPSASEARDLASVSAMESIAPYTADERAAIEKGRGIYAELCYACHGADGRGEPLEGAGAAALRAPAIASSPRVLGHKDYVINVLLYGLTGPINGTSYSDVMIPMGQNTDEWVASVASYSRNAFGNRAPVITAADVANVRAATAGRRTSWSVAELDASLPKLLPVDPAWTLSASHNSAVASNALSIQPWTSGVPQQPGMWIQIELAQPTMLTQLQFESVVVDAANVLSVPGAPTRTVAEAAGGGRFSLPPAPTPVGPMTPGFPRGYEVRVSLDGTTWTSVAQGTGTGTQTDIRFAPVRAKFIRVTQTVAAPDLPVWSIQRLRLFEPGVALVK